MTLIPRGQARGLTWFIPGEDPTLISKQQIFARIVGALGGRATEQVVFGDAEVTTGASSDLAQVTTPSFVLSVVVFKIFLSRIGGRMYMLHNMLIQGRPCTCPCPCPSTCCTRNVTVQVSCKVNKLFLSHGSMTVGGHMNFSMLCATPPAVSLTVAWAVAAGDVHGQADGGQLRFLRHWPMVPVGPLSTVSGHDHAHDGQEQHFREPADED